MPDSRRPFVEFGGLVLGATVLAFFFAVVIFLFGIDYLNVYLALAGLGSGFIGLFGLGMLFISGTLKPDMRSFSQLVPPSFFYTGLSLIIFVFVDAFVPRYFSVQFLGFPLYSVLNGLSIGQLVQVGLVFTVGEAVMEELLRMGVANIVIKYVDVSLSWLAAPVAVGALFFIIHIPAYGYDLPILLSLAIGPGAIITVFDIRSRDGLTGILSHAINNGSAWAVTSSILVIPGLGVAAPLEVGALVVPAALALQLVVARSVPRRRGVATLLHLGRSATSQR